MSFKYVLGQYIKPNNSQFKDQIIYQDEDFVLIRDQFPKSIVHWLLLPKDPKITFLNPLTDAFRDPGYRNKVIDLTPMIKTMIMEETAKLGYEVADQHNDSDLIKVGVHSIPSLSNLHIHFITKDLSSEKMKRKHHFNSFATKFFVNFEDLPLKDGDSRLSVKEMEHVCNKSDMICPFCGKNFTNRFAELKKHLQKTEFQKIFIEKKNKSVELIEID